MAEPATPEPLFADALGGAGGMADPAEPVFSSSLVADVFPDALSASPLPGLPSASPEPLAPPSVARPVPGPPQPGRAAPAQRPRPWEQYPPPGQPAYRPPPTAPFPVGPPAQLAPPSGRRPTAGPGYQRPLSIPAAPPVRPPAFLPQRQGLAQIRSTVAQARGQAGTTGFAASSPGFISPAPPGARANPAARAKRRSGNGAWGCLVVVGIVLVSSGAAQKIISAISNLLQRK